MARRTMVLALLAMGSVSALVGGCGGKMMQTYTLTVNSSNPGSGVSIEVGNPFNNLVSEEATPFTVTGPSGGRYILGAPKTVRSNAFGSWTGCTSAAAETCSITLDSNMTVTAAYKTPAP